MAQHVLIQAEPTSHVSDPIYQFLSFLLTYLFNNSINLISSGRCIVLSFSMWSGCLDDMGCVTVCRCQVEGNAPY